MRFLIAGLISFGVITLAACGEEIPKIELVQGECRDNG